MAFMAAEHAEESTGPVVAWQRVSSRTVHSSSRFRVQEDAVIHADGRSDTYMHVVVPASVTVLAVDDADRVVLVRAWIHTHGGTQWQLPGGRVARADRGPGEAARRELERTAGLRAVDWAPIGSVHGADSLSNHVDHLFLAARLTASGEASLRVRRLAFADAVALVRCGQLPHAGSAHALLATALARAGY
jgi:ADP-ribose pyrophosphatase